MKQANRAAVEQVEKKGRLIGKRKEKEPRKLARDKVQFINKKEERLKRKELSNTRASKHEVPQAVVFEIRIPGEKDLAAENKICVEVPKEAKTARTASSLTREKENVHKANNSMSGIFATLIEDNAEFTENGNIALTVKAIRKFNKEIKRGRLPDNEIEVKSTNFYKDFDRMAAWLSAVERENLGQFQRTPRENKTPHDGGTPTNDQKNSEHNACKSSKNNDKLDDKRGFLKLPQINDKSNCLISSRNF